MRSHANLLTLAAILLTFGAAPAVSPAQTPPPASGPAASAADVPEAVFKQIDELFTPPASMSPAEVQGILLTRMQKVMDIGRQALRAHPHATNLTRLRLLMLQAVDFIGMAKRTAAAQQDELALCNQILASDAKPEEKLRADYVKTRLAIKPLTKTRPEDAKKAIPQFVQRYANTSAVVDAYLHALVLADQVDRIELKAQYGKLLKDKYLATNGVKAILKRYGQYSDVGRPFEATLTKLDGSKLTLPADLAGKAVVVYFWSSTIPACTEGVPGMKTLYERYKDRGVEFVGICLDTDVQKAQEFVKTQQIPWPETCSGQAKDPTVVKYAVTHIPTLYILDKEGKIVSENAASRLEEMIGTALTPK